MDSSAKKKQQGKKKKQQPGKIVKRAKQPFGPLTRVELGAMITHLMDRHKLTGKPLSELKRDIPYFLPDFRKETQIVEARLYYLSNLSTVAATVFNTVTSFTAGGFNNFSDFASIFDEYRLGPIGEVHYAPSTYLSETAWSSTTGFCIACIDYGVSAANGSQLAAYSHDNKQMFYLIGFPQNHKSFGSFGDNGVATWKVEPEPLPDQDWIPTTTNNTVFYYWKPYMESVQSPGTGTVGKLLGWHNFQFRGMAA